MGKTTEKGEIGEAIVLADLRRQGHEVAIPFGHNLPYDLIVIRRENGRLERVQVKYTTSDGRVVQARIGSSSAWVSHRYTKDEVDWMAIYDATSNRCFYLPSALWDGQVDLNLRLVPTANGQAKRIRFAKDFVSLGEARTPVLSPGPNNPPPLPLDIPPE